MTSQMTIAERNAEMATRRTGLLALDRKNLVAQFVAYWPATNTKGVPQYTLVNAIISTEMIDGYTPAPTGARGTETWGK